MMDERAEHIALLDAARQYSDSVLDAVRDPAMVVHAGSGWTVADVTGHVLAWERVFGRTLDALVAGDAPFMIEGFTTIDAYNWQQYERGRGVPLACHRADLRDVRERIKTALRTLPPESLMRRIRFGWPVEDTVSALVLRMAAHERAHMREIAVADGAAGDP